MVDIVERLRIMAPYYPDQGKAADEIERLREQLKYSNEFREIMNEERCDALEENERLRGALRTINSFIPKTKEITAFPHWVAIAGDIAEGALNGTWPAYRVMPAPAKEKE